MNRNKRFLWFAMFAFILLMIASLIFGIFNPLFFGSDGGRTVQGIDFFGIPKAYLNLLEGRSMFDTWGGMPFGSPHVTFFSYHPAFPVFFASYLSFFSPWVSYWVFTFLSLGMLGYSACLFARLTQNKFEKQMCFIIFFCSFVTYWLLYVGNMHAFAVLSYALVLVGMYQLTYLKEQEKHSAVTKISMGLLLSLFSKPVLVLLVPVLLINKETRIATLRCLVIYVIVSLAFLFIPLLNPESIGLKKMLEVAMNPDFIREHLNIYTQYIWKHNYILDEYMKDNSIHWFYFLSLSQFSWNHIDIFSFSALLNSLTGINLPGFLYKIPVLFILICSLMVFFIKSKKERLEISLLILIATGFGYFLSYNTVWEYQYTSLFPPIALMFLMYRQGKLNKKIIFLLILCIFYYLPSPYFLVRENLSIANINWIRSTKVIPAVLVFICLSVLIIRKLRIRYKDIANIKDAPQYPNISREPLKTKKSEANEPEKAELPRRQSEFEGEIQRSAHKLCADQRRNSKFLEIPSISSTSSVPIAVILGLSVLLFGMLLLTYSNHFNNAFHFDDSHCIENNVFIRNIKNIPLFFKDGTTFSSLPSNQTYRPVVSTTLAIDYWLGGGLNLFCFHISTFILFVLQGLLMFFLFRKIFNNSTIQQFNNSISLVSLFAVAWYLLHPANAETINYVIARSDSISTFFVVMSLVMYIYSPLCRKYLLYLLPVAAGSLAKIPAIMFAPLLLVYIILFENKFSVLDVLGRKNMKAIFRAVVRTIPAFLFCAALYLFVRKMDPETWVAGGTSRYLYLISQPYIILHYFKTFFFPLWLTADTDWVTFDSIFRIKAIAGFIFIALLLLLAIYTSLSHRLRPISFGIFWFFITLIPSSSVIPLAEVMNDHRIFFPYIGLAMAVVWALYLLFLSLSKKFMHVKIFLPAVIFFCLLLLSVYAYGTYQRNNVWHTEESLWKDVIEKSPKNARGLMNYGLVLMSKADYKGAELYFTRSMKLWPYYAYLYINMGILKNATGYPAEAEQYFKKAITYRADLPEGYYYYAELLHKQNRVAEAIQMLQKTLQLSSAHVYARDLLMTIYFEQGEFDNLRHLIDETLKIIPDDTQAKYFLQAMQGKKSKLDVTIETAHDHPSPENYIALSLEYYNAGKYDDCIRACQQALKLKPDYDLAYNNICSAYNMLKQWNKAIEAGEKAVQLNPNNQLAKNNLNWARQEKEKK